MSLENNSTTNTDGKKGKKPSSPRQIQASRANGAKSHGPVTPEGKARSSQNARKHGCLAAIITFTPEDERAFNQIHDLYVQRFEPRDQTEHDLVEQIVYCNYQMRQAWAEQASLIGLQVAMDREKVGMEWTAPTELDRRSLALVESLKESNAISLLQRYERSLSNQAERATKMLMELKKHRLPPALVPGPAEPSNSLPNEPEPDSGHPEIGEQTTAETGSQPAGSAQACPVYAYLSPEIRGVRFVRVKHATEPPPPLMAMAA